MQDSIARSGNHTGGQKVQGVQEPGMRQGVKIRVSQETEMETWGETKGTLQSQHLPVMLLLLCINAGKVLFNYVWWCHRLVFVYASFYLHLCLLAAHAMWLCEDPGSGPFGLGSILSLQPTRKVAQKEDTCQTKGNKLVSVFLYKYTFVPVYCTRKNMNSIQIIFRSLFANFAWTNSWIF